MILVALTLFVNKPSFTGLVTKGENYSVMEVDMNFTQDTDYSVALRDQPEPQLIFHRPLQMLFNAGFEAGFVIDKMEERAFPADHPAGKNPLSWGANFSQIPPVLVVRMRLV